MSGVLVTLGIIVFGVIAMGYAIYRITRGLLFTMNRLAKRIAFRK